MPEQLHQVTAVHGRGVVPTGTPVVDADDLGLTRGNGCFDATRVRWIDGEVVVDVLDAHVARLCRSASALGITAPDPSIWANLVAQACEAYVGGTEAAVKLVLTGGGETLGAAPVAYVTITEMSETSLRQREGITVVTLDRGTRSDAYASAPWLLGGVKSLAYAVNVAAKDEAHRRGADDVLFVSSDGYTLEGPTSAILVRRGRDLLTTPPGATGILASITVDRIGQAAGDAGMTLRHELFTPEDVAAADGAWLLSSVRGVAPIRRLDGEDLAVDVEGDAIVRRLAGF